MWPSCSSPPSFLNGSWWNWAGTHLIWVKIWPCLPDYMWESGWSPSGSALVFMIIFNSSIGNSFIASGLPQIWCQAGSAGGQAARWAWRHRVKGRSHRSSVRLRGHGSVMSQFSDRQRQLDLRATFRLACLQPSDVTSARPPDPQLTPGDVRSGATPQPRGYKTTPYTTFNGLKNVLQFWLSYMYIRTMCQFHVLDLIFLLSGHLTQLILSLYWSDLHKIKRNI